MGQYEWTNTGDDLMGRKGLGSMFCFFLFFNVYSMGCDENDGIENVDGANQ
jgi:hypothetical protein